MAEARNACIEWAEAGGTKRASWAKAEPFTPEPFISRVKWEELNAGREWGWKGQSNEDPEDFFYELQKEEHEQTQKLLTRRQQQSFIKLRNCQLELETRQFLGYNEGKTEVARRFRY